MGFLVDILQAFYCFLNIIFILFYLNLLLESVLRFPALLFCILWEWLLLRFNWLVVAWCRTWVWGISEHIAKSFVIYGNHWDVFFGEVVSLFCFSVLRKSCGVNVFLLSSYFTDIGLLHWYFSKSLLSCI